MVVFRYVFVIDDDFFGVVGMDSDGLCFGVVFINLDVCWRCISICMKINDIVSSSSVNGWLNWFIRVFEWVRVGVSGWDVDVFRGSVVNECK